MTKRRSTRNLGVSDFPLFVSRFLCAFRSIFERMLRGILKLWNPPGVGLGDDFFAAKKCKVFELPSYQLPGDSKWWPFQGVKWPPTRGWKGHFESPGRWWFQIIFYFHPPLLGEDSHFDIFFECVHLYNLNFCPNFWIMNLDEASKSQAKTIEIRPSPATFP